MKIDRNSNQPYYIPYQLYGGLLFGFLFFRIFSLDDLQDDLINGNVNIHQNTNC